jgi:N-acyl-D-amino-acid deacylase
MTLLIKNVLILGGDREFPEPLDVFVNDEKISAIGKFPGKKADHMLDGQGAYLSPGFIDVNTDSDHYLTLFDHPSQEDFLRQGVTTIFGGMCGSSLAPLLYGSLESVRKWGGSEDRINVNWHTVGEFLQTLDKRRLAVNFGTLVGHATIRRAIVGDAIRELTKNELAVFSKTLEKAMNEGAFGLSTNLGSVHAQKVSYTEVKSLAQMVAARAGVYATHLRESKGHMVASVEDVIKLGKDTGVNILINHFVPMQGVEKEYERSLALIDNLSAEYNLNFDIYPFDTLMVPFYTFLPDWVRMGGFEVILANIQEEWLVPKMIKDMERLDEEEFIIAQAPDNDFLVGKSLRDIREMYGSKDPREALIKLMVTTKMRGVGLYKNLDKHLLRKAIVAKRALVASNAPSFGGFSKVRQLKSDRTTKTFTQFLKLTEEENILPLKDAIRKITLEPAQKFGLVGRGQIKEGNYADLACFKNGEIKFTVVNGKVVIKNGDFQDVFPGHPLRKK